MHLRPLLLLCSLLVAFSLSGCSSKGSGDTPVAQADTTVLVYVIGSDLETRFRFASHNIDEMMQVGSTASMNVVLQTGGAKAKSTEPADPKDMQPSGIDWARVQRFVVHKGSLERIEDLGPDEKDSALDMGSPVTLKAFLKWGVESYPARKYIVILWDHGGGVNEGVGPDEMTGTALPVAGISKALDEVSAASQEKFTIVGFDTCLMGTAEVAASLASSTEFMVASQDLEPGPGWDYKALLEYVTQNPDATGDEIGITIVDTYVAKSTSRDPTYPVTLSVIDLSMSQHLVTATGVFATALERHAVNAAGWNQIALARQGALDWETSAIFGVATDLVDMDGFVTRVVANITGNIGPDAVLAEAGAALRAAIDDAVVYSEGSGSDEAATGLTVYFPSVMREFVQEDTEFSRTYATNTMVGTQPYFASAYTDGKTGLVRKYFDFYEDNKALLEAKVTMGANPDEPFAAMISTDFDYALASHRLSDACKLYSGAKVTAPFFLAPCYDGMQAVIGRTSVPAGGWKIDFAPAEMWPHIWDFPIVLVPDQISLKRTGEYANYLVPVFAYDEEKSEYFPGFLRVEDTFAPDPTERYEVIGFQFHATRSSGKVIPLEHGQFYALGAFHAESGEFLRTDRAVFVEGKTLQITEKLIAGGEFTYFVADLTGAIKSPEKLVHYPPVIVEFGANPDTIDEGTGTYLFWDVRGATTISIAPDLGIQSGTYVAVKPATTTTYTLTASNGTRSERKTVTVTVKAAAR